MNVYSPSEVSVQLEIKTATLRKYSLLLEKHGYIIERNSKSHRYYRDKDIMTLRSVITGMETGVTLEESIIKVVEMKLNNDNRNVINNDIVTYASDITDLKEMIHKQSNLIEELTGRLDQQEQYIINSINKRDKELMLTLNEMMETRKQIASEKEKDNRGFLSKLFKK